MVVMFALCWFYFQAAVWHALNHYAYRDAVFLAERLYAEGKAVNISLHAPKPPPFPFSPLETSVALTACPLLWIIRLERQCFIQCFIQ